MQEKVYKTKIRNVEELRQRIVNAWDEFDQVVIDAAIGQWRARLRACVEANGGHFEQPCSSMGLLLKYNAVLDE